MSDQSLPDPVRQWLVKKFFSDPTPSLFQIPGATEPEPMVLVRFEDFAEFLQAGTYDLARDPEAWKQAGWIADMAVVIHTSFDPGRRLPHHIVRLNLPLGRHRLIGIRKAVLTAQPATKEVKEAKEEPTNRFELDGTIWRVRFGENESGSFEDRKKSSLRHLARLLAEPNQRFRAESFYSDGPLPYFGRDDTSDEEATKGRQKKLEQLAEEIKEADDAQDCDEANRLIAEFNRLMEHEKSERGARKAGRKKKCGTASPGEKANQALRVALDRRIKMFRNKGLPQLAAYLEKHISNDGGEWYYAPPPETAPWQVIFPNTSN